MRKRLRAPAPKERPKFKHKVSDEEVGTLVWRLHHDLPQGPLPPDLAAKRERLLAAVKGAESEDSNEEKVAALAPLAAEATDLKYAAQEALANETIQQFGASQRQNTQDESGRTPPRSINRFEEIALRIDKALRREIWGEKLLNALEGKKRGKKTQRPLRFRLTNGQSVCLIAFDMATAVQLYEVTKHLREPTVPKRGRPSLFSAPEYEVLFRECVRIYEAHVGFQGHPGHTLYRDGKLQWLAREALSAVGDANAGAGWALVRALRKAMTR